MDDSRLLLQAARSGEKEVVEKLIQNGCPLDEVDQDGRPAITVAVEEGHLQVIEILLDAGCLLDRSNSQNSTYGAHQRSSDTAVTDENDLGLDVDTANANGAVNDSREVTRDASPFQESQFAPPLHAAVCAESEDIVKLLISTQRADVNYVYKKETPLIIAAKLNLFSLVKTLVEAGANVNFDKSSIIEDGLTTPIHYAVVEGNYEMVAYFIEHGAKYISELPLNVRTYRIPGAIALRYFGSLIELACQNNQPEILDLLIDSYASDISFLCKHYAMLWCCQMDCKECLDILLDRLYSSDCELNNAYLAQNHQQVLRIALRQNSARDEAIPLRLLDHFGPKMFTDATSYYITLHIGVLRVYPMFVKSMIKYLDMFPATEDEETVHDICYSALNGVNLSILKDLYSVGLIDLTYIDHAGENAAFNVVQSSKTADIDDLVSWLTELNVDFTRQNNRGLEPIHIAVGARVPRNIDVLVRHGVDVDSLTSDGQTPLHLAMNTGWELERNVVQSLLDNGASLDVREPQGRSPVAMFVLSYFNTFQTGQTWCLEARNGWRWCLELLSGKLGCFLYRVHVIGHVTESEWQGLLDSLSEGQRSNLQSFPTLQTLCWSHIRARLGGVHFKDRVGRLPLPQPLCKYLLTV